MTFEVLLMLERALPKDGNPNVSFQFTRSIEPFALNPTHPTRFERMQKFYVNLPANHRGLKKGLFSISQEAMELWTQYESSTH